MQIKYIGHASFVIKSKDAKLITDPFDSVMVGIKYPKQDADIVTVSHQHEDHNAVSNITGAPLVIDWPGEFEKSGIRVSGFKTYHDVNKGADRGENTLYKIEADGVTVLHCGDLGHVPSDTLVDEIGDIDILLIPVGGHYTINADEAMEVVKKIEPSYVIPMHYNNPLLNQKTFSQIAGREEFVQKFGAEKAPAEETEVLTVKGDALPEETQLVLMKVG